MDKWIKIIEKNKDIGIYLVVFAELFDHTKETFAKCLSF